MSDRSVGRLDVVALYRLCASQVLVVPVMVPGVILVHLGARGVHNHWKVACAPNRVAAPVCRPAVVAVVFHLVLAGDWNVGHDRRAALDLRLTKLYLQRAFKMVPLPEGMGKEQNQTFLKPRAGVHNHVSNHPAFVVEVEVLYVPDVSIMRRE